MATDPVCGMYVDPRTTKLQLERENRTYYFCAEACLESFARPELHRARLQAAVAQVHENSLMRARVDHGVGWNRDPAGHSNPELDIH